MPQNIDNKFIIGIIGSFLLIIGVFSPIISAPIIGTFNYYLNGQGPGVIVLIIAIISLGITYFRKYVWLIITGFGSLGIILYSFFTIQNEVLKLRNRPMKDVRRNHGSLSGHSGGC